jgi:hypothetical protein
MAQAVSRRSHTAETGVGARSAHGRSGICGGEVVYGTKLSQQLDYIDYILLFFPPQALIVQDGPLASPFRGFLITHTDTVLWTSDQPVAETIYYCSTNTYHILYNSLFRNYSPNLRRRPPT